MKSMKTSFFFVLTAAFLSTGLVHASDLKYKVYNGDTVIEGANEKCQLTLAMDAQDQVVGFEVTGIAKMSYPVLGVIGAEEFKNIVRVLTMGTLDPSLFQAKHYEVSKSLFGNLVIGSSNTHDLTFENETLKVTIKKGEMTKFKFRQFSSNVFFPVMTLNTVMECRNLVLENQN